MIKVQVEGHRQRRELDEGFGELENINRFDLEEHSQDGAMTGSLETAGRVQRRDFTALGFANLFT